MKLNAFDLDGTRISSYMDAPGRAYHTWRVLPGRIDRLKQLRIEGAQIGIVTNQAGVALGFIREADFEAKIAASLAALELPADTPVAVCYAHSRGRNPRYRDPAQYARRKPSGAMIRELMKQAGVLAAETLYIGDHPEDEAAARDAGVGFMWADQFFADQNAAP